jgi:hypothetical protein
MKTLFLTLLMISSAPAFAEDHISIDGFEIGMRHSAFLNHIGDFSYYSWQHSKPKLELGGVPMKVKMGSVGCNNQAGCSLFNTGTIDRYGFKFDGARYEDVKTAVEQMFPMTCSGDTCTYEKGTELLTLERDSLTVESK